MPLSVCPAAEVNAPINKVWNLLYDPASYGTWADANVKSIEPIGFAQAGQIIRLTSKSIGLKWNVYMNIISVDAKEHRIILETHLPFKLMLKNNISCIPLDEKTCVLRFG